MDCKSIQVEVMVFKWNSIHADYTNVSKKYTNNRNLIGDNILNRCSTKTSCSLMQLNSYWIQMQFEIKSNPCPSLASWPPAEITRDPTCTLHGFFFNFIYYPNIYVYMHPCMYKSNIGFHADDVRPAPASIRRPLMIPKYSFEKFLKLPMIADMASWRLRKVCFNCFKIIWYFFFWFHFKISH